MYYYLTDFKTSALLSELKNNNLHKTGVMVDVFIEIFY
ncbi:hypothetical protein EC2729250_5008 [Escherichia coli 2729250]|nr:hypothetical protein ECDEC14B_5411 [Escherichia coli DEC14B]EHX95780.1 hypothetical protein ECDEC14D_0843 [Escherichia coli DEC14D]EMV91584.1 hypothetical protein EC2860050_3437 [Escherichia coli 2860050]EMW45037.1 hypothetical protein EC2770900_4922 [Escherichia coli 2770900]EMW62359.1 hypothetical protein EC2749250_5113 [Escherichia coli 2749250]EMW76201.1 hypothetical protein EC2747800_1848 [Escherichia coli 2747800]EMX63124.1 hypothetical protein ECENVIRA811_5261 [Escherichia coli Envi